MSNNTAYLQRNGQLLIDNGYSIIPIQPGTKSPGLADWSNIQATSETLDDWLKNGYEKSGVGILTKYNPVIDIDVSDETVNRDVTDYVSLIIGDTPVRVGNQPKRIMLTRADAPFRKIKTGKYRDESGKDHEVEILGEGQQFVAYGIHKDTGLPYKWVTDSNPTNTPSSALPQITQDQAILIIEYAKQRFKNAGWTLKSNDSNINTLNAKLSISDDIFAEVETKVDLSTEELCKRLMMIQGAEDHDLWVKIGMALYHQFDGEKAGLKLWHKWSKTASNYDAEALDKRYTSFGIEGKKRAPTTARLILKLSNEVMSKTKNWQPPGVMTESPRLN